MNAPTNESTSTVLHVSGCNCPPGCITCALTTREIAEPARSLNRRQRRALDAINRRAARRALGRQRAALIGGAS